MLKRTTYVVEHYTAVVQCAVHASVNVCCSSELTISDDARRMTSGTIQKIVAKPDPPKWSTLILANTFCRRKIELNKK